MNVQDKELEDKIAQFDALFDEPDEPQPPPRVESRTPSVPPIDAPPAPVLDYEDMPEPEMYMEDDDEPDVVRAMQQLLLKHEDTQVNRIEDPNLVRVLEELRTLAHSNIADVFECEQVMEYIGEDDNDEGIYKSISRLKVRDLSTLPREVSACIQSIKVSSRASGDVVEVKMYDKQVSLDKLMRFHGAYVRDNEQQGDQNKGVMDLLLSSIGSQGMPTIINNDA